jgi:hypothetical protein
LFETTPDRHALFRGKPVNVAQAKALPLETIPKSLADTLGPNKTPL